MSDPRTMPAAIERAGDHDVRIRWKDGHESLYPARYLRLACPCAACIDELTGRPLLDPARVPLDVHPEAVGMVGHYAMSFRWSDGHSTGIYGWVFLRDRCPCPACAGPSAGTQAGPTSTSPRP